MNIAPEVVRPLDVVSIDSTGMRPRARISGLSVGGRRRGRDLDVGLDRVAPARHVERVRRRGRGVPRQHGADPTDLGLLAAAGELRRLRGDADPVVQAVRGEVLVVVDHDLGRVEIGPVAGVVVVDPERDVLDRAVAARRTGEARRLLHLERRDEQVPVVVQPQTVDLLVCRVALVVVERTDDLGQVDLERP